jgi:hypothetical protein
LAEILSQVNSSHYLIGNKLTTKPFIMKTLIAFFILITITACNDVQTKTEKSFVAPVINQYDTLNGFYGFDTIAQIENYYNNFSLPEISLNEEVVRDTLPHKNQKDYFEEFGTVSTTQARDSIILTKKHNNYSDPLDDFGSATRAADPLDEFGSGTRVALKKETLIQKSGISKAIYEASAQIENKNNDEFAAIRSHVTWLFDYAGNGAPKKAAVWRFMVPLTENITVPRGFLGARSCGNYAVLYGIIGKNDYALKWLQAAQAHNPPVMNLFAKHPEYTVNFAITNYGARACAEMSIPFFSEISVTKDFLNSFANSYRPPANPPSEPSEPREPRGGGRGN